MSDTTVTQTKTIIVKSRGRLWFTGVMGGRKARLAIDAVTTNLPLDQIVTFEGEDLSTRTDFGVDLKFRATAILSVRDAAQARAAAEQRKNAERWLGYAESDVRDGFSRTKAIAQAMRLAPAHPELSDRLAALQAALPEARRRGELAEAQRWMGYAEIQVRDGLTSSKSITEALNLAPAHPELTERLATLTAALEAPRGTAGPREISVVSCPPLNVPVRLGSSWVVVTKLVRRWIIDDDTASMCAGFAGHDGDVAYTVQYRDATPDEAEQGQAQADADAAHTARQAARRRAAQEIAARIRRDGEKPAGSHLLHGTPYLGEPTIYGGGAWIVVEDEHVWVVQNNGMDGDSWDLNNVRTGGAGAIGWRVLRDTAMVEEIIELHEAGTRLT